MQTLPPAVATDTTFASRTRAWARGLLECVFIVVVFFFILVVFTEELPRALSHAIPDHTFHFSLEGDQSAIKLVCYMLGTVFVAWVCSWFFSRAAIGLQLHGWRRSIVLITFPYALCVAGAIFKPGHISFEAILALLMLGLSAATSEEIVFRGLIMHRLGNAGFSVSAVVIAQALFFGLAHLGAYGAQWWTNLPLAIFCGVARQYSRSLIGPIVLHGTRGLFLSFMSDPNLAHTIGIEWMTVLSVFWFLGFLGYEYWKGKSRSLGTPELS